MVDKKPLAEWLKYNFGLELNYVVGMMKRRSLKIKVNGVSIKNMSYSLKEGDIVEVSGKPFTVKWKKENKLNGK